MDSKGRVSIPAGFRPELQVVEDEPPVLTGLVDCPALGLYSAEHWREVEDRLSSMSQMQPEVQAVRRLLLSSAVDCAIDGQGRILVPPHLREHAGLEREITIAGVGPRIELWDTGRYDEEILRTCENRKDIANVAAQAGL